MGRFSAWFSRLWGDLQPVFGPTTGATFDGVDRYFLALRVGSAAAAGLWLWKFAAPGAVTKGIALTAAFVTYSLVLYRRVWQQPDARARAYLAVLPADLVFLFLVCLWSAQPMSGLYLAFYLLIALHAFYFGAPVGLAAAAGFAGLYATLYIWLPTPQRCTPDELVLRLGFALFVAASLARVSRYLHVNRDHLARVNLQLQHRNCILEQTYRHLSLGRLAGGVAHNINNPAAIIVSKAELMRQRAERDGLPQAYREDLAVIAEHAFRIGSVVRSLVALSPQREGPARSFDLAKVTEGVVLLFENHAAERHVRIERHLALGLNVTGQESSLRQVIVNLVCNALDAVEQGGEVVVETRTGAAPDTVELRVCDNGHGIAPEHLDDIFSPFFTTKNGPQGIGLGLSLSLTIVRRLRGTLAVESSPGNGSIFVVTLPANVSATGAHEEAA